MPTYIYACDAREQEFKRYVIFWVHLKGCRLISVRSTKHGNDGHIRSLAVNFKLKTRVVSEKSSVEFYVKIKQQTGET